ncbi:hypothetical protein BCR33DRAFT_712641 [Rhizoclosmatium globosum]|uniref:Uncharacterized protein n=1 Tax=Rhizoclosmatium globosum TaxID=329046 RepID=A0A1Y2CZ40_9FUNG|nr:hypothetical protein BCR33DRAFT_712641 [Rhizoclosmatium globosum]|eukprot:ORY51615.1 hypothetical protein BCR33DRAFT_712641 [Rhizoclosmatium globosum]
MFNNIFRSLVGQSATPHVHRQLVDYLTNSHLFRQFVHRTNHQINNLKTGNAEPFKPYVDPHHEPGFISRFVEELKDGFVKVFGGRR